MKHIKLGIFTETFLPQINGVAVSIYNINKELVKSGYRISVFTTGKGNEKIDGYSVYRFKGIVFKPYPEFKFVLPTSGLLRFFEKEEIGICHSRSPFGMGILARKISRKHNIPLVSTYDTPVFDYVHYIPVFGSVGIMKHLLSSLVKRYVAKYYNSCDVVIAPSEAAKKQLQSIGCRKSIEVISNGIDTRKFNRKNFSAKLRGLMCPDGELLMLHVGRIAEEKRIDMVIKAAEILAKRNVKFRLVIIGRGPEKQNLEHLARKLKLSEHVHFLGFQPESELVKYYASADLFVTASPVETEGIVLLEAMASGLPVIGSGIGAVPELIEDGRNGYVFSPYAPINLANKIEFFMEDSARNKRKMMNFCRKTAEVHSIEKAAEKIGNIYERCYNGVM